MRYILFALVFSLSFLVNGQNVLEQFNKLTLDEQFETSSSHFPQKYNAKELFMWSDRAYIVKRIDPMDYSVSYARLDESLKSFHMVMELELMKTKENAAGLVVHGQKRGNGGIIIEINSKKKFRIKKLYNGQEKYLSISKKEGWIKSKYIRKKGRNTIEVKSANGYYDLYINGYFVYTVFDLQFVTGECGFYVKGGSEMRVHSVSIFEQGVNSNNPITDSDEDTTATSDVDPSFQEVILLFKTKIDQQQNEINELQAAVDRCKSQLNYDTTLVSRSSDLETENERLLFLLDSTSTALEAATSRLEYLESFREDVEAGSNGDLVLNLTSILADIKKENASLKEENLGLKNENQELEKGNGILLREVERLRKLIELQNQ